MADPQATDDTVVLPGEHEDQQLLTSIMCGVCHQGLQTLVSPDGARTLIHSRAWMDYDHQPIPVEADRRKELLCDFCGATETTHWHLKGDRIVKQTGNYLQDYGDTWGACEPCGQLLQRNDLEGLLDRSFEKTFVTIEPHAVKAARLATLSDWLNFLRTVEEMTYVGPWPGPAKMTWQMMPKLQVGLIKFWKNPNLKLSLCTPQKSWLTSLPSFVCGDEGTSVVDDFNRVFPVGVPIPEQVWDRHVEQLTASIWDADLYWVSSQFTSLAIMAGKDFETPVLSREDLPSESGFLVWQDSVGEMPRGSARGGASAIRAVSWNVIPDGIWVAFYVQVEDADPDADVTAARQSIGWLLSPNTGGAIRFGEVDLTGIGLETVGTFLATLFLLNQPGVAEVATAQVDKREARKYQRNHRRSQPAVKLINLRHRPSRSQGHRETGPRGPITWREYRKGHWKMQPFGPKRGQRRPHYVSGYIAGPDGAPLRPIKPDVKVLK